MQADCPNCSKGIQNHCARGSVSTYGGVHPGDEGKSYGGYATHNRSNGHFVLPIPDGLDSADAAPMMCGGVVSSLFADHDGKLHADHAMTHRLYTRH